MERKFIDNYGEKIINFYEKVQWPHGVQHCIALLRGVSTALYGENCQCLIGKYR